jgi:hypothetical protein
LPTLTHELKGSSNFLSFQPYGQKKRLCRKPDTDG